VALSIWNISGATTMKNSLHCALLASVALAAAALADDQPSLGEPAPDFELPDQEGQLHSLEDYRDSWVVLYFYPKDETPGCTTEACEFRDDIFAYRKLDAQIIGVSLDDVASHSKFAEKHGLPFPLLADTEGAVAEAYGVKTRKFGFAMANRETFIIDPGGAIAKHYDDVDPDSHSAEVLDDLKALADAEPVSAMP
jgi:thioredoxin-dependent peroxiredoxin